MREPGHQPGHVGGEAVEHEPDALMSRRQEQRRKCEPERELEAVQKASNRLQEVAKRR